MVRRSSELQTVEDDLIRTSTLTYEQSVAIIEALWNEGVALGVLPPKDPQEGLADDIRLARILNSCSKRSSPA